MRSQVLCWICSFVSIVMQWMIWSWTPRNFDYSEVTITKNTSISQVCSGSQGRTHKGSFLNANLWICEVRLPMTNLNRELAPSLYELGLDELQRTHSSISSSPDITSQKKWCRSFEGYQSREFRIPRMLTRWPHFSSQVGCKVYFHNVVTDSKFADFLLGSGVEKGPLNSSKVSVMYFLRALRLKLLRYALLISISNSVLGVNFEMKSWWRYWWADHS